MRKEKRIIVTGAHGQLGSEIRELSGYYPFHFIFTDFPELDLCNTEEAMSFFQQNKADYIINCAAYTAVDMAETDAETARAVNSKIPELLSKVSDLYHSKLIHISTDYVFSGEKSSAYVESDPTSPLGVYGQTKLEGELAVQKAKQAMIIRTAWLYSSYGHNFVKSMLQYMQEREELTIVDDQIGSPTYAADLAKAILDILSQKSEQFQAGIYHYANTGSTSWYGLTRSIQEKTKRNCTIKPIQTKDYPTPAKRPKYSILATQKISEQYNLKIAHWEDALDRCLKKIG